MDNESILTSIKVQGGADDNKSVTETNLVDWNNWEEGGQQSPPPEESVPDELELFKDMEPTIDKTKVVHVKKTVRAAPPQSKHTASPQQMSYHPSSLDRSHNSSFNLNPKYQVEAELGVLDDDANEAGGWDDDLDENFVSQETETMIQTQKTRERERRLAEQRQKKMERDLQRAQKKQDNRIGVKIK